jgi:hypothetical protein
MKDRYWIYKDLQKVYIELEEEKPLGLRNEDKAIDYEMEAILAGLHTDSFNEDAYYQLKYDRFYHQ